MGWVKDFFTRPTRPRTWLILVVWFMLTAAFSFPAWRFWSARNFGWADCVYGRADCSLAVGTYLLCLITGFAVTVAVRALYDTAAAAKWAAKSIEHQKTAILATQKCSREGCARRTQRKDIYVLSLGKDPPDFLPADRMKAHEWYDPIQVDCLSVGLAPILSGVLQLVMIKSTGDHPRIVGKVYLGTIGSKDRLHLNIHVITHFEGDYLRFTDAKHEAQGSGNLVDLEYHYGTEKLIPEIRRTTKPVEIPTEKLKPPVAPTPVVDK